MHHASNSTRLCHNRLRSDNRHRTAQHKGRAASHRPLPQRRRRKSRCPQRRIHHRHDNTEKQCHAIPRERRHTLWQHTTLRVQEAETRVPLAQDTERDHTAHIRREGTQHHHNRTGNNRRTGKGIQETDMGRRGNNTPPSAQAHRV